MIEPTARGRSSPRHVFCEMSCGLDAVAGHSALLAMVSRRRCPRRIGIHGFEVFNIEDLWYIIFGAISYLERSQSSDKKKIKGQD